MRHLLRSSQRSSGFRCRRRRRGVATLLALLVVTVMSVLALGFYSSSTMNLQIAANQQRAGRAAVAADSGMEYMRLQLANISVPHGTSAANMMTEVYADLQTQLNTTATLGGASIALDTANAIVHVPALGSPAIAIGDGTSFRAQITNSGTNLNVKVFGFAEGSEIDRGIKMDYAIATRASRIFDYGVASKSKIAMNGNAKIRGTLGNAGNGSVLSTTLTNSVPVSMIGNALISGDLSIVNPNANSISISSGSTIAGYGPGHSLFRSHVHAGVEPPEFPTIDTSIYAPYATTDLTSSSPTGRYFKNIRIKANTNPSFSSNTDMDGVVYIEYPNHVRFAGNMTIRGAIVVETNSQYNMNLNPANSSIHFGGNVTVNPLSSLPATSDFPAGLRSLSGAFLLAPGFSTTFRGNFGTVGGTIISSKLDFSGNSGGTINGTVINLNDTSTDLAGNTDIIIVSQGTQAYPSGVYFGSRFSPLADTYREVTE